MNGTQAILACVVIAVPVFGIIAHAGWTAIGLIKRRQGLERLAQAHGYQFLPSGDLRILEQFPPSRLFGIGHVKKVRNLLRGHLPDAEFWLVDFECTILAGLKRAQDIRSSIQTVLVVSSPALHLPHFSVRPRTLHRRLQKLVGKAEVSFVDSQFADKYVVYGEDEVAIGDALNDPARTFLQSKGGLSLDMARDRLMVYRRSQIVPVKDVAQFIGDGLRLSSLFRTDRG
jgi:hypothetical protein